MNYDNVDSSYFDDLGVCFEKLYNQTQKYQKRLKFFLESFNAINKVLQRRIKEGNFSEKEMELIENIAIILDETIKNNAEI